jgi:hypothetical protein
MEKHQAEVKRAFSEVRRRTEVVGRFPGEMATLEEDRLVWRVGRMDGDLRLRIVEASRTADESIGLSVLDSLLGGGLE